MIDTKYSVGERVSRPIDVYGDHDIKKFGVITAVYDEWTPSRCDGDMPAMHYEELYEVQWDDGKVEKGFLPHGLDLVEV